MVTFFCLMAIIFTGSFVALFYIWVMGNEPKAIHPDIIKIKTTLKHPWGRRMIAGGQARLALWCHLNGIEIPSTYTPRDIDYVSIAGSFHTYKEKGILLNRGTSKSGIDDMLISSIWDYFNGVDLITNQVIIKNETIYTTQEAIDCFKQGLIKINPHQLNESTKVDHYDYLLLRACIQAGYDIYEGYYHHRHGACKLPDHMISFLDEDALDNHWYIHIYNKKMIQIKGGNH